MDREPREGEGLPRRPGKKKRAPVLKSLWGDWLGRLFEPAFLSKELQHEEDGWHVYSDDGAKHLGGPYESKDDALARLRQVEAHKVEKADKKTSFQGIDIVLDRPVGYVQRGKAADGTEWERTYSTDYGYIDGTEGGDGEALDVFVGDAADDKTVHWAIQRKADGTFDEYKIIVGAGSRAKAEAIYIAHIPASFLHGWHETTVDMLKALLGLAPSEVMKALLVAELAEHLRASALAAFPVVKVTDQALGAFVAKAAAGATGEQRYVLGSVLIPDVVDGQGDTYTAEEVERTAWLWASDFRNMGLMHKALVNDKIQWVETYIVRADVTIGGASVKAGTWMLGAVIKDDELWSAVQQGRMTGWSIGGRATKRPA